MKGGFIAFRCGNFDNTAEREQFRLLCKKMKSKYSKSEHFYLMIANYNIYDCEFDAIVIKHDAIIAVEFKNYGGKIIAKENGDWTANGVIIKGGSRKTVYQQARVNHAAIKNGLRDLGVNNGWLRDIPTVIVFHQTINLENQLSSKTQSWLHITDNAHFLDKIEDITCPCTELSNINIIDFAIKLNLNSYIVPELSSYQINKKVEVVTNEESDENEIAEVLEVKDKTEEIDTNKTSGHEQYNQVLEEYNRFTPNHIFSLRPQQLFVFGTDRQGSQKYGASGIAAKKFGAEVGVTEGKTGFCYALPTRGFSIDELRDAVIRFIKFVDENNQYIYLVTPVGCGHAGFTVSEVAEMFKSLVTYENVMLPQVFINEYIKNEENKTHILELDESLGDTNNSEDNIYQRIKLILTKKGLRFNNEGTFLLKDELGNVIAEAEIGIESEKVVISPFNIQSELVFKNQGYSIMSPEEYLENQHIENVYTS